MTFNNRVTVARTVHLIRIARMGMYDEAIAMRHNGKFQ